MRKLFLTLGIIASVLYVFMNILCAALYEGYSSFSQTISELSAIDTPTRALWVPLGIIYTLLMALFGIGVWKSTGESRYLKVAGILFFAYGVIGVFWPPMHQREVLAAGGGTFTDKLHIIFTVVTILLMVAGMSFGAAAFGKSFRIYSIATIVVLFVFGMLTASLAGKVEANLPTPWAGVWERINVGAFLVWVIVFAIKLLNSGVKSPGIDQRTPDKPAGSHSI